MYELRDDLRSDRRLFLGLLAITLLARGLLAAWLPMTGDEAYFYFWGKHPDWGFYDHPPMVGWWLAVLSGISEHPFVLRLPALLVPPVLALLTARALTPQGPAVAWGAASLLLLAPLNAWNVAITTDIPLMFFAGGTVLAWLRARRTGATVDYLLAGLLLGGALLSKYFSLLLAAALFWHAVLRPVRGRWKGLLLVALAALPAVGLQALWNSGNCYPNLMFNLVNRHGDAGLSWKTPPLYLLTLAYVVGPWVFGAGLARLIGRGASRPVGATSGVLADRVALAWMALFPFAVFLALSLVKTIGLHWLASFVLPAILWFALSSRRESLQRALRWSVGIALAHYVLIVGLAAVPIERWQGARIYDGLVMTLKPAEFNARLEPYRKDWVIASDGYSAAATIGFNLAQDVPVFGPGSSHARHDDILTDFRALDGRDILIVRKDGPAPEQYTPYFRAVTVRTEVLRGAEFHFVEGRGFRYEPYRDAVLENIRARWYAVPAWLPRGPCYFCDRYFPERSCHR